MLHSALQSAQRIPLLSDNRLRGEQRSPCFSDGTVLGQYIGLARPRVAKCAVCCGMLEIAAKEETGVCSVPCIGGDSSTRDLRQNLLVAELFTRLCAELVPERGVVGVLVPFVNDKLSMALKNVSDSEPRTDPTTGSPSTFPILS